MPLVSIGLPVRNGAQRLEPVVRSVLAQDEPDLELVISDNASTDDTEELCRKLAGEDPRIGYHRQPEDIGLVNNFIATMRLARGTFYRWIGDDDWLAPGYLSRCLAVFAADERLVLVTTQISYAAELPGSAGRSAVYDGTALGSDDPAERFAEMLRLLNESFLLLDPLYGLIRREVVAALPRRVMLREDQILAARLALAGPWGHVPEVLAHRNWRDETRPLLARRIGVPAWQARMATALQSRELLRCVREAKLSPAQRRRARAAVAGHYLGWHRRRWATALRKMRGFRKM
ncbi:MAG TPA: glycosyltransferase family A protein, partial [Micromonosporaceae bacterium]|nr:glycosyltransferase family A protein [Micromonosporaceae bacterium]